MDRRYYADLYKIKQGHKSGKKFYIFVEDNLTGEDEIFMFGDAKYEDYTMHKDPERKKNYRSRHANDYINDPMKPGFWSYWLLWNKKTLEDSIVDTEKRYDIDIEYNG